MILGSRGSVRCRSRSEKCANTPGEASWCCSFMLFTLATGCGEQEGQEGPAVPAAGVVRTFEVAHERSIDPNAVCTPWSMERSG